MQLASTIEDVAQKLREGRFPNEQSISQGIVLRVLSDLGWEVYDTNIVWPEYSTGEGRVDFALCAPPGQPRCFVEVKQPGMAEVGVKQALEYAFHTGAQFVTLTDGQTWSFYLPAEQGSYEDRRVCKLDLFERTEQESAGILRRYLERECVASGEALNTARQEYRDRNRRSAAGRAIPGAWAELVERGDESLVELLTNSVESKSGIRPEEKDILGFLAVLSPLDAANSSGVRSVPKVVRPVQVPPSGSRTRPGSGTKTRQIWDIADEISARNGRPALRQEVVSAAQKQGLNPNTASTQYSRWARSNGLTARTVHQATDADMPNKWAAGGESSPIRAGIGSLHGKEFSFSNAKEAMVFVLSNLATADASFLQRCSQHPAFQGRTRRYLARRAADLYPGRPDLVDSHEKLPRGWVVGTNLDNRTKMKIIQGAADVAGIRFGRDVIVNF